MKKKQLTKKQEDQRIIAYIDWCKQPEEELTNNQKLDAIGSYITDLQSDVLKLTDKLLLARRTHVFYLIIGLILGCGGTLFGIGIGLATGAL